MDERLIRPGGADGVDEMMFDVKGDISRLETMLSESGWPEFGPH
jgi:hypothetical protein